MKIKRKMLSVLILFIFVFGAFTSVAMADDVEKLEPHRFNFSFSVFEQPDASSPIVSWFNPQTVAVVEAQEDGWLRVATYRGDYWAFAHCESTLEFNTHIQGIGDSVTVYGTGVTISDGLVNIWAGGTYLISGAFNGQIRVTAPAGDDVRLILHEAWVTNPTGAALYIVNDGLRHIETSINTRNSLRSGNNAAIHAGGSVTLGGEGSLAARGGIRANRDVNIRGGDISIRTYETWAIGIRSGHSINIYGGNIDINAAYEGMEADFINIHAGSININSVDDGINITSLSGALVINGGEISITAQGDGIDSNGTITIRGGKISISAFGVCGQTQALDLEGHHNFRLYEGVVFVGTGRIFSNVPQGHTGQPTINIQFNRIRNAGIEISLRTASGQELISFTPELRFSAFTVSIPELVVREAYHIYLDGVRAASVNLNRDIIHVWR
ncbi:MAG: carbohydrate-binding domain-containing protein [Clostridiales bacterium]|jgi:hypothetical protein|nr:carbohydrate-binding domain-containing protein [Clostridiales bacterium]